MVTISPRRKTPSAQGLHPPEARRAATPCGAHRALRPCQLGSSRSPSFHSFLVRGSAELGQTRVRVVLAPRRHRTRWLCLVTAGHLGPLHVEPWAEPT